MRIVIQETYDALSKWVADYVVEKINSFEPSATKPFILGLPTGSSPMGMYKELIRHNEEGRVSFRHVITFNMDEYINLPEKHPESYHNFMWNNFFSKIGIPKANVNIPNGNAANIEAECERYEQKIKALGGIDLFLGGIGSDGHIAFNEPGSSLQSRTRVKTLSYDTIQANSRFFENDITKVPKTAITVGIATIMDAREVLLIINGFQKARALKQVVQEGISHMWPASVLQMHPHAILACDDSATMELNVATVRYFKDIESIAHNKYPENRE